MPWLIRSCAHMQRERCAVRARKCIIVLTAIGYRTHTYPERNLYQPEVGPSCATGREAVRALQ